MAKNNKQNWGLCCSAPTRLIVIIFVLAVNSAALSAPPAGFVSWQKRIDTISLQGQSVQVSYVPSFRIELQNNLALVKLHVEGDLTNLQTKLPAVFNGTKQFEEDGDRVYVEGTTLRAVGNVAHLRGSVRYEKWKRACTKIPEFRGFKVTFNNKCIKTRLVRQTAQLCADLTPSIINAGKGVAIQARVTCAKPSSNSLLGRINSIVSLEGTFERLAQTEISKVKDKLKLAIPKELNPYSPRLTSVKFFDRGNGRLGLVAEGSVRADAQQVMAAIATIK